MWVGKNNLCAGGMLSATIEYNGFRLQEVGDFGDENCLPPLNLIRSIKLNLTTKPPISFRCCYGLVLI